MRLKRRASRILIRLPNTNTLLIFLLATALCVCLVLYTIIVPYSGIITQLEQRTKSRTDDGQKSKMNFVTIVMPSVVKKDGRDLRLDVIKETWGIDSRAIFIVDENSKSSSHFSSLPNILDRASNSNNIFPKIFHIPSSLPERQGVKRLVYILSSIHHHVNPDFAFFVNDHTFVLADNLVSYLNSLDTMADIYAGHALKPKGGVLFNSGAAGYILSRSTLSSVVHELDHGGKCMSSSSSDWINGNPGLVMAKCIQEECGIKALDTRDGISHRFHAFGLVRTVTSQVDDWYIKYHRQLDWFQPNLPTVDFLPSGPDCCSNQTITFHYVEHSEAKALFHVRNKLCHSPLTSDQQLKSLMQHNWPSQRSELGFYAHALPETDNHEQWSQTLNVMRKICKSCQSER